MIPRLSDLKKENGHWVWHTSDGTMGVTVRLSVCDVEAVDAEVYRELMMLWLRALPTPVSARFVTVADFADTTTETLMAPAARAKAIGEIGFRQYQTHLSLEINRSNLLKRLLPGLSFGELSLDPIWTALSALTDLGLAVEPLNEMECRGQFPESVSQWVQEVGQVSTGIDYRGIVRLVRPRGDALSEAEMAGLLRSLAAPFELVTQVRRLAPAQAELFLRKRLKQSDASDQALAGMKSEAAQDVIMSTVSKGQTLLEYEVLCLVRRESKRELLRGLSEAASAMRALGDVLIETIGIGPSLVASRPGAPIHVPLLEVDETLPVFLPIWRTGEVRAITVSANSLLVHRRDQSISCVEILARAHQNSNAMVIGASGRGKSAFLGCLTHSLLHDADVQMIKVDVGGSHSKECELVGGREHRLSMEESSGLNPLELIAGAEGDGEFERSVIGQFIEVLTLEEGESRLSKQMKFEIDECLKRYFALRPESPSLSDLRDQILDFPRRNLLGRWCRGGLYGRAFDGERNSAVPVRLRYFNFSQIFQASDPDFAQGVMAAVLAVFNLEMRRHPQKRFVLVCDETPFFIQRCFEFFKFSTANVRKFGAAVVLVTQLSRHLMVGDDTGVIDNCHHRFIFSADGGMEEFCARMHLNEMQFRKIEDLSFQARSHSELLYQVGNQAQVLRLWLAPMEYWRVSSTQSDRMKLEKLMLSVPGLKLQEAIQCLSVRDLS